jgi:hypothetical protein
MEHSPAPKDSSKYARVIRGLRIAMCSIVGIMAAVMLTIMVLLGVGWLNARENITYTLDTSVMNPSAHTRDYYSADHKLRGVAIKGLAAADFATAVAHNIEWVSLSPFMWQETVTTPTVTTDPLYESWAPTPAQITHASETAHDRGLHVMLKPHMWITGSRDWRAQISMSTDADWERWFRSYGDAMIRHAAQAESLGVELFCVGTELRGTLTETSRWRQLIAELRSVFSGRLTYAANWDGEFGEVEFWDALDYIGVQAYFPLSDAAAPDLANLIAAWEEPVSRLAALAERSGKPIIFTEIGYRSIRHAATEPWGWGSFIFFEKVSKQAQQSAYEAFFTAVWDRPWFAGTFMWVWYPRENPKSGYFGRGFSPQDKPAANTLAKWFGTPPQ